MISSFLIICISKKTQYIIYISSPKSSNIPK